MITVFKNIRETSTPFFRDILFILNRIKVGVNKDLINEIRCIEDKTKRNELKKQLAAICFSGKFSKRSDDSISEHSGYICLDFDNYKSVEEMHSHKEKMMEDPYVFSVFVSPSGKGIKVIIRIGKDIENHGRYFNALKDYFDSPYFDKTSKNISRVCYESYDPDIYINEDSTVWVELSEVTYEPIESNTGAIVIKSESKIIDILMKWWESKFGLVDGERNNNVFILSSAFNEYGVSKSSAEYIIHQMQSNSFPLSEIQTTIDSAYKNTNAHGSKYYQDTDTVNRIKRDVRNGVDHFDIKDTYNGIDHSIIDKVITSAALESMEFWSINKKGVVSIVHHAFKEFLEGNGFYKYSHQGANKYMYVKVTDNLIDVTDEKFIKGYVLDYVKDLDNLDVYDFFINSTRLFKDDYLSMLDSVDVYFIKDTIDTCYIYFRNCALKVSPDKVETMDYIDLDGYVWRDQVIQRDYKKSSTVDCDFKKFISNVASSNEKQIRSFESTIGYLLSSYKDPSFSPAVILNDEIITDNPEGGTGKGLFVMAISQIKKVSIIEGKKFSFDSQFAYQNVTTDSQVIQFDDVRRGFNFEMLFSVITEGITVEKKNKDAISIPFSDSPKIIITTNYAIRGKGNSFERRKWEIEFKKFYSMDYTPYDEFKSRFFDSWSNKEYCAFDNYMVSNLQLFLREGLIKGNYMNLKIRKLSSETCHEFIEWVGLTEDSIITDSISFNKKLFKDDLYSSFIDDNPDFAPRAKMPVSRRVFYKWLVFFGEFKEGVTIKEGRSNLGRWIMFILNE